MNNSKRDNSNEPTNPKNHSNFESPESGNILQKQNTTRLRRRTINGVNNQKETSPQEGKISIFLWETDKILENITERNRESQQRITNLNEFDSQNESVDFTNSANNPSNLLQKGMSSLSTRRKTAGAVVASNNNKMNFTRQNKARKLTVDMEEEPNKPNYETKRIVVTQHQQRDLYMVTAHQPDSPEAQNSEGTQIPSNHKFSINEYGIRSFDSNDLSGYCFKTYNSNMDPSLLAEMTKYGPQSTEPNKNSNILELKRANISPILTENKLHISSINKKYSVDEPHMMRSIPNMNNSGARLKSKFRSTDQTELENMESTESREYISDKVYSNLMDLQDKEKYFMLKSSIREQSRDMSSSPNSKIASFSRLYDEEMIRQRMKKQKLRALREENLKKELQECTFSPNINNPPYSPKSSKQQKKQVVKKAKKFKSKSRIGKITSRRGSSTNKTKTSKNRKRVKESSRIEDPSEIYYRNQFWVNKRNMKSRELEERIYGDIQDVDKTIKSAKGGKKRTKKTKKVHNFSNRFILTFFQKKVKAQSITNHQNSFFRPQFEDGIYFTVDELETNPQTARKHKKKGVKSSKTTNYSTARKRGRGKKQSADEYGLQRSERGDDFQDASKILSSIKSYLTNRSNN